MSKNTKSPLMAKAKPAVTSVISSLLCIVIGLVLGYLFLLILHADGAWEKGFLPFLQGGFGSIGNETLKAANSNLKNLAQEIVEATPLIMCGLSVAFAYKTGLFNIGAAGQYTIGALGAFYCAIVLELPWWLCLIVATLCGALWGAIPGIFKAYLNVNEVITCIMFNWIGLYGTNTIIYGRGKGAMYFVKTAKTKAIATTSPSHIPNKIFGWDIAETFNYKSIGIAILLTVVIAIVIYVVINKTTFGYELKACGHNKFGAKYAGINEKRNIILSMVIAGALAGMGAGLYYLTGAEEWDPQNSTALPACGFNGIAVALLANSHPIGCIFSGLFMSHLSIGGNLMTQSLFPSEIADAVSGIIVYLCAFSILFKSYIARFFDLFKKKNATTAKGGAGK